jgi:3-hydroxyisobutyrate dehydrogenase-like beta-hydroxyacid dehydrogenase
VKVSVLGLGQMGTAIAERLIDAGHSVSVWNRSEGKAGDLVERGATEITSVHDAWEADVCITMLDPRCSYVAAMVLAVPDGRRTT